MGGTPADGVGNDSIATCEFENYQRLGNTVQRTEGSTMGKENQGVGARRPLVVRVFGLEESP